MRTTSERVGRGVPLSAVLSDRDTCGRLGYPARAGEAVRGATSVTLRFAPERRLAEMLAEMEKHSGGRPAETGRIVRPVIDAPKLSDLGIERRLGEMLAERPKLHGARPADTGFHDGTPIPISDLGILRDQSSRWQRQVHN